MKLTNALFLASAVLFCLFGCKQGDNSEVADKIITHFAGSCQSSVGGWTSAALKQTQSLISVLDSLRSQQDADCAGIDTALQTAQSLEGALERINTDPDTVSYQIAQEKKLGLLNALSRLNSDSSSDPALIQALRDELYKTELDLVEAKARDTVTGRGQNRQRVITGISQLNRYVSQLLSQGNLAACAASNPTLPFSVASSLLSVGGNFATPVVGASFAGIGHLIDSTMAGLRHLPIDQAKLDLPRTEMQAAMTCSLEVMSDLYCDADSSWHFIKMALDSYNQQGTPNSVWEGMDLISRRMPVLNDWLIKVSSGVDPKDQHAADRLNEVWEKQNQMRQMKNSYTGEMNRAKRLVQGASSPTERLLIEKNAFKQIIRILYLPNGVGPAGPFNDFLSIYSAICRLTGDKNCQPDPNQGIDELIDKYDLVGGLEGFQTRLQNFASQVSQLVTKELQNTINQDPDILVSEAIQSSLNNWSPLQVLKEIAHFANNFADRLRNPKTRYPGKERTIALAQQTSELATSVVSALTGSELSGDVIEKIFKNFKLLDGIQFINRRVSNLVEWDLQAHIKSGDLPKDVSQDMIAAGRSLVDQLEASGINLQTDADELASDIRNAQYISRENLRQTTETYGATIGKLMESIKKSAQDAGESEPTDPGNYRLAELCILALTTSVDWPKDANIDICKGVVLESVYKNSGLQLSFDELRAQIMTHPKPAFKGHVCIYSHFLRASRLFIVPEGRQTNIKSRRGHIPISQNDLDKILGIY